MDCLNFSRSKQGDSGSFVGMNYQGYWYILGVNSFGKQNCGGPSYFTSTSYFADWVAWVIKNY